MFGTIGRMDPLAEVLEISRVRGAVLAHVVAHDPWGMRLSSTPGAAFHAIAAGTCWLRVDGQPPRREGRGSYFGEIALLRDVPRTASVRAATDVELYALERDYFIAAVTGHAASREAAEAVIGTRLGISAI